MVDGGRSPELELYMTRAGSVGRAIIGAEFYSLIDEIESATELETAESLYDRAFHLLHDAYTRVRRQPGEYERLLEWRNEPTIHGTGHPNFKDVLFEASHELLDWTLFPSDLLLKKIGADAADAFENRINQKRDDLWRLFKSLPE